MISVLGLGLRARSSLYQHSVHEHRVWLEDADDNRRKDTYHNYHHHPGTVLFPLPGNPCCQNQQVYFIIYSHFLVSENFYIYSPMYKLSLVKVQSYFRKLDGIFNYTEFVDNEDLSEGRILRKTHVSLALKGLFDPVQIFYFYIHKI